jgi:hypothetical protein
MPWVPEHILLREQADDRGRAGEVPEPARQVGQAVMIGAITTIVESLSDEQIAALLVRAIRLLEARGLATVDDAKTLELLGETGSMAVQLSLFEQGNNGNGGQATTESPFDSIRHTDRDGAYWLARELQEPLEYTRWENFQQAVDRARQSCENSGENVNYHFREATKMIEVGKGGQRIVVDYRLSKHACYLVLMNGDPRKQVIADAQAYFVEKTMRQESHEQKQLKATKRKSISNKAPRVDIDSPEAAAIEYIAAYMRRKDVEDARRDREITEIKAMLRGKEEETATPILPASTTDAPEKTLRTCVGQLVRSAAYRRGVPHAFLFSALYREFRDRTHHDVVLVAKNRDIQVMDVIEELGMMNDLYAIALEMFGEGK